MARVAGEEVPEAAADDGGVVGDPVERLADHQAVEGGGDGGGPVEPQQLAGKIAIVTGGTQGLGEAIARLFVGRGAAGVVVTGRNAERGERVRAELEAAGFTVSVGGAVNSEVPADLVAYSSPGGGTSLSSGDTVVIYPSTGYVPPPPEPSGNGGGNGGGNGNQGRGNNGNGNGNGNR